MTNKIDERREGAMAYSQFGGKLSDSLRVINTFSLGEVTAYSTMVKKVEDKAYDRGYFKTLGAGAYIDKPSVYLKRAAEGNKVMIDAGLMPAITRVAHDIQRNLKPDASIFFGNEEFDPDIGEQGLPGFHVISDNSDNRSGMFHVDMPYQRFYWPGPFTAPFTFTTLIETPDCGSGLWHWDDMSLEEGLRIIQETRNPTRSSTQTPEEGRSLLMYEVGHTYVHSGRVPHAIANTGDMKPGEYRITLQGHGAYIVEQNALLFYF